MDRIVETQHGYDCIVGGVRYGTWSNRGAAKAGLATEQARLKAKEATESARQIAQLDQRTQDYHEWRNRD